MLLGWALGDRTLGGDEGHGSGNCHGRCNRQLLLFHFTKERDGGPERLPTLASGTNSGGTARTQAEQILSPVLLQLTIGFRSDEVIRLIAPHGGRCPHLMGHILLTRTAFGLPGKASPA
ncbi:uncharacterized protein LOC144293807 [Canis aureus]